MEIKVKYVDAVKQFPKAVEQAMNKLRKSKSKFKTISMEELDWSYQWCQAITGGAMSFAEMIADAGKPRKKPKIKSVDERFQEIKKDLFVTLAVSGKGSTMFYHSENLETIPMEIEKQYKDEWVEEDNEKARFDALPKAEQNKEISDTLKELSGMGGFMGIQIGSKGVKRII